MKQLIKRYNAVKIFGCECNVEVWDDGYTYFIDALDGETVIHARETVPEDRGNQ